MLWIQPSRRAVRQLGILAGTFNPVTCAHLALAHAVQPQVDEILLALPRTLPHKQFHGATLHQRQLMLRAVCLAEPCFAAAVTDGGLLAEMADEIRTAYGPDTELTFICGRDAAERIVTWPYPDPEDLPRFLASCRLVVAPRHGEYVPPPQYVRSIVPLLLSAGYEEVSASEIRRRIRAGQDWESLVPEPIIETVRAIYS